MRFLFLLCLAVSAFGQEGFRHDLVFKKIPVKWDEALPLGNGLVGALIWQKDGKLRISIDRSDLWDSRPTADLDKLDFAAVQLHVKANTYDEVQRLGDVPYERDPAPTRIPGAAIEFDISTLGEALSSRVRIKEGIAQVRWGNQATLTSFIDSMNPAGWFRFSGFTLPPSLVTPRYADSANVTAGNSVQGQGLARLGYAQGTMKKDGNKITYYQRGWGDFVYHVTVEWQFIDGGIEGVWAISTERWSEPFSEVWSKQALLTGFDASLRKTTAWWKDFWSHSSILIPDSLLERQWYLEQYKFGCTARAGTPPITLQAIWTADNGNLPPWKGDIHNDLNLQLSYWPAYSGNHLKEAEGMVNWLQGARPEFERWTRQYFGKKGLNVPGVTTLEGKPMGGWIQYSLSPTTAGWLGHHFYLHWRYSMDRGFLQHQAYPWIRDFGKFIQNLSVEGASGTRKLPLSSSPEFYDNSIKAWFTETTNYDLAIIRWTFTKAAELATELGLKAEAAEWKKELARWPELAFDPDGGLSLAPGHPYPESHRHFSHMLGVHPLGILQMEKPAERKVIEASVQTLLSKGTYAWVGYSFAWLGNLYARMGNGEDAAETLRKFATCFCLSNSFHANGDQCGGKHSSYTYRPFTLEGNFAFAAAIQEMLLQSHHGVLRIFPAIPQGWKNLSFEGLRAEGAFVVSAKRTEGVLTELTVVSEMGGELVLADPPAGLHLQEGSFSRDGNKLIIRTRPGQKLKLL